jgi:uncharacterized protein YggU (UPF0235/DUF167 family)
MSGGAFRLAPGKIIFAVRLTPKGGRDAIEGWQQGADNRAYLKVRVSSAPHDRKANEALIALLAQELHVTKSKITIVSGASARLKKIEVDDDCAALAARLTQWEKSA